MSTVRRRLADALRPAVTRLTERDVIHVACRHLVRSSAANPLLICALHPLRGLLCRRCLLRHVRSHGDSVTCALCGVRLAVQVYAEEGHEGAPATLSSLTYEPADLPAVFAGNVTVELAALPLCASCHGELDRGFV